MAGEDLPFRIDARADGLRHAEDDAAGERAPEAAEPADDHRLEGIEQPRRADGRIEVRAAAEEERRDGADRQRKAHGDREDAAVVDAHELRRLGVVRGGAEGAAEGGAVEEQVQREDHQRPPRRA